jgi:TusA-related sulfurtransferase
LEWSLAKKFHRISAHVPQLAQVIIAAPRKPVVAESPVNDAIAEVDARGLACPLPLLKAKKALNALGAGECLRVWATDSGSVRDFRVFCEQSGHQLLESLESAGVYSYLLRKKPHA